MKFLLAAIAITGLSITSAQATAQEAKPFDERTESIAMRRFWEVAKAHPEAMKEYAQIQKDIEAQFGASEKAPKANMDKYFEKTGNEMIKRLAASKTPGVILLREVEIPAIRVRIRMSPTKEVQNASEAYNEAIGAKKKPDAQTQKIVDDWNRKVYAEIDKEYLSEKAAGVTKQ